MKRGKVAPMATNRRQSASDGESVVLANNPQFQALIEESRASYRKHGGISLDEIRREFGLKKPRRRHKTKKPAKTKSDKVEQRPMASGHDAMEKR
jgi:hypothetical protein